MSEHTQMNIILNEDTRNALGIANIEDKMEKDYLHWYLSKDHKIHLENVKSWNSEKIRRGRSKSNTNNIVKSGMNWDLQVDMKINYYEVKERNYVNDHWNEFA